MNKLKKLVAVGGSVAMMAGAVMPMAASAQTVATIGGIGDGLGEVFVLDRLFRGGLGSGITSGLGGTSLGDLFILDQLFNGGILGGGIGSGSELGQLFVLSELFGGGGLGSGVLDSMGGTSLGDLFILNQLFD